MSHHLNAADDEMAAARDLIRLLHMATAGMETPEGAAICAGLEQLGNLIHNARESLDWARAEAGAPQAA